MTAKRRRRGSIHAQHFIAFPNPILFAVPSARQPSPAAALSPENVMTLIHRMARRISVAVLMSSVAALTFAAFAFLAPASAAERAAASSAVRPHTIHANGVTLHYLETGQGSGTPVVLLHGYAETSHMWLPLMTSGSVTSVS
ncbi:alpha/beta fold hydrolase [Cupriavidus basilensis]